MNGNHLNVRLRIILTNHQKVLDEMISSTEVELKNFKAGVEADPVPCFLSSRNDPVMVKVQLKNYGVRLESYRAMQVDVGKMIDYIGGREVKLV